MSEEEFLKEFGLTFAQAKALLEEQRQQSNEQFEQLVIELEQNKKNQTIAERVKWFAKKEKLKQELINKGLACYV